MQRSENRLRLKVKRRDRSSIDVLKNNTSLNTLPQQQRSNPFANQVIKKRKTSADDNSFKDKSALLSKLDSIESLDTTVRRYSGEFDEELSSRSYVVKSSNSGNVVEKPPTEEKEWKYINSAFPLDWSIKQKVQIICKDPLTFCSNLKSIDKAESLMKFASCSVEESAPFYRYLCNWIHPSIPSVPNFPLKRTVVERTGSREETSTSTINSNPVFQEAILQQWRISFQSLFNMLKNDLCPYFYMCGHQFAVLLQGRQVTRRNMKLILTPSTKGLRTMLTDEGIEFSFTCNSRDDPIASKDETGDDGCSRNADNENDADSFLDSLGLSKDEHFPNMEEQRKLTIKSELNRLDNRPESTIEISDVQGFFNFFTNSSLICATSGRMIGVPPTLISPVVFEGASCHVNKHNYGKVKHKSKLGETYLHCLDIYGFMVPTQLRGVIDLQVRSSEEFSVRTKGYENMFTFNAITSEVTSDDDGVTEKEFIHQQSRVIPDQNELRYEGGLFKF